MKDIAPIMTPLSSPDRQQLLDYDRISFSTKCAVVMNLRCMQFGLEPGSGCLRAL